MTRLILFLSLFVVSYSAHSDYIYRHCNAEYKIQPLYGKYSHSIYFGRFFGKGKCGESRKHSCKTRARDIAQNCMKEHWRMRYSETPGNACQRAVEDRQGVVDYYVMRLNEELTNYICQTYRMAINEVIYVNIYGDTHGHAPCRESSLLGYRVRITCP